MIGGFIAASRIDPLPDADQISEMNYWSMGNTEVRDPARPLEGRALHAFAGSPPPRSSLEFPRSLQPRSTAWECPGPLKIVARDGDRYEIIVYYAKPRVEFSVKHRGVVTRCVGPGGSEPVKKILAEFDTEQAAQESP